MKQFKLRDAALLLITTTAIFVAFLTIDNKIALQTVTSNSMKPFIEAGDILITKQIHRDQIELRDVVVLPIPEYRDLQFSHRIIRLEQKDGNIVIQTKGDANPNPDKWALEITSEKIPKVIAVIPSAPVLDSPIGRRTLFFSLLGFGVFLLLLGFWRLVRAPSS